MKMREQFNQPSNEIPEDPNKNEPPNRIKILIFLIDFD